MTASEAPLAGVRVDRRVMPHCSPVLVSYGAGTNSTAMLVEMVKRGEKVDAITFADTGGERAETYAYVSMFSEWLQAHGFPAIQTVKKGGREETLEENCLRMKMLPSVVYGFKSCSLKYKAEPQEKFANNWQPARDAWARGDKVVKCLGFDADEPHRAKFDEDNKYRGDTLCLSSTWGAPSAWKRLRRLASRCRGKAPASFARTRSRTRF